MHQAQQKGPQCDDWLDWKTRSAEHAPYHYWLWDDSNVAQSQARLGQRMYTTACLLWASMHDAGLGRRLASRHPNWSAISYYYSMVHSLRLTWFVLYGGYPTGHSEMARPLTGKGPARPDWAHGSMQAAKAKIYEAALIGAIRDGLQNTLLAESVRTIGGLFDASRELREDANYESLLLAHQYFHHSTPPQSLTDVDMTEEFTEAQLNLCKAANRVHEFTSRVLLAAFNDEVQWFAPRDHFTAGSLIRFVTDDVNAIIKAASVRYKSLASFNWWNGPLQAVKTRAAECLESAEPQLGEHRHFDAFDLKRTLMQEFRNKVSALSTLMA